MPRSSTLPQSFPTDTSTPTNDSKTLPSASSSPWTNKLSTGYSTFKLAANRINELKSSFSTSNTNSPVKLNMANMVASSNYLISQIKNFAFDDEDTLNDKSVDVLNSNGQTEESFDILDNYHDLFATLNQHYSMPIEPFNSNPACNQTVFQVQMMSCTICRGCSSIVYDEEIMCKWGAEDSNLNTKCIYCNCTFVPSLTIFIQVSLLCCTLHHAYECTLLHTGLP